MAYKRLRPHDLKTGLRVEYRCVTGTRLGMVASDRPNHCGQYEVFPEGISSARPELWPLQHSFVLPMPRQLSALGGKFNPPKGYPFFPCES